MPKLPNSLMDVATASKALATEKGDNGVALTSLTPTEYLDKFNVRVAIEPVADVQYELVGALMEQRGDLGIVVTVLREDGSPSVGDPFVVNIFPDGHGDDPRQPDGQGVVSFSGASTSSAYTPPSRGPFTVSLVSGNVFKDDTTKMIHYDTPLSPSVQGLGDYLAQHTRWYLQFRKKGTIIPPPPPPPPSDLPVVDSPDELRNLANNTRGIPFLASAALVQAARAMNFGVPMTPEARYVDSAGVKYAWQAFSGGILYCAEGDWGHIKVIVW